MAEYQGDYYDVQTQSWHINSGIYFDKHEKTSRERDGRYEETGKITLLVGESWETDVVCEQVPDEFGVYIWSEITRNAEVTLIEGGQIKTSVFTSQTQSWEKITLTPNVKRFMVRITNRHSFKNLPSVKKIILNSPYIKFGEGNYGLNEWLADWELKKIASEGTMVWVKIDGVWKKANVEVI